MTIRIEKKIPLAPYTTFKIGGQADFFVVAKKETDLVEAIDFAKKENANYFILGGGSNVLVSDHGFSGLVIKNEIKGIEIIQDKGNEIKIKVGAGENWDGFVRFCVEKKYYGLENLSQIPGTVGASPVQNIGAYGVEAGDYIYSVRVYDTKDLVFKELSNKKCLFAYRDSIFKKERGRYVVCFVTFSLLKKDELYLDYFDLKQYFINKYHIDEQTDVGKASIWNNIDIEDVREAIISIRKNKLPDWQKWGTAGSFFKNPYIKKDHFIELKNKYPGLTGFEEKTGLIKVSLGYVLDNICKAKGMRVGSASVYEKQALVIISNPGGTSSDVVKLSRKLTYLVKKKTNIDIECEVEWVV
jgi:UDP-N-acetylmuramate dehydrogenase